MRPRDEQGWRVPRSGTVSANIYALAKKGLNVTEIAKQLGRARSNVGVHLFKIKRPERANQLGNGWKNTRLHERKKITQEEAHARKVASVLGISLDQARALARGDCPRTGDNNPAIK